MEARLVRTALVAVSLTCLAQPVLAASYRTTNFIVEAPTPAFARQVGEEAERLRRQLALEWLGHELPNWTQPCPVRLQVSPSLGAGGATSFSFDRGEVFGWQMDIQGSAERILDSVLPHEITHTVFASHFRQPLPRWADEGACTTVEHQSERSKQDQMLIRFLKTGRGIAFSRMFAMKEYPRDIMPLYSQGYSLARYLIAQGGKRKFIEYVGDGLETQDWVGATTRHYTYPDLAALQSNWLEWVRQGCPQLAPSGNVVQVAAQTQPRQPAPEQPLSNARGPVFRGQSADTAPAQLVPVNFAESENAVAQLPPANRIPDGWTAPNGNVRPDDRPPPAARTPVQREEEERFVLFEWRRPGSSSQAEARGSARPVEPTVDRPLMADLPASGSHYRR